MSITNLTPPAGFKATSIALVDDGACRLLPPARQYRILFHKQGSWPQSWLVTDSGIVRSQTLIFQHLWGYTPVAFRQDTYGGRWSLLWSDATGNAIVHSLDLGNTATPFWTDTYSATEGLRSRCGLLPPDPPCVVNQVDAAPGAGHVATSFQTAQDTRSNLWANNLLWSKTDGTAKIHPLKGDGIQSAALLLQPPLGNGWTARSLSGAPSSQLICPPVGPPGPPPG